MLKQAFSKYLSAIVLLIVSINLISSFIVILNNQSVCDTLSVHYLDSAILKVSETTTESKPDQKILSGSFSNNFFSYEFITDQFIKSQKKSELIFTNISEINIRTSTFLLAHSSTST